MLKKVSILLVCIVASIASFSQTDLNKWSIGLELGHNGAMTKSIDKLKSPNLGYLSANARYMTNPRFGMMLQVGYNGFKFKAGNDDFNKVNYLNFTLEGVANLGQIMNFSSWSKHIGLLLHTGPGGAINGIGNDSLTVDKMLVGRLGLSPIFKLGNKFMLSTDLTFNGHLRQGVTFDRYQNNKINGVGVDGYFFTASVGLTYYIGKAENHADWAPSRGNKIDALTKRVDELETNLENALKDDDKDGVPNSFDDDNNTPAGAKVNSKGVEILDTDKDGISDDLDACPEMPGKFSTNGCPDSDNDGVADKDDKCPEEGGVAYNNGCPPVAKAGNSNGSAMVTMTDVTFNSESAVIKPAGKSILDNAATVIKASGSSYIVNGHADDQGDANYNMNLSVERANAVKAYLVSKGVDSSKLTTKGYGETQPKTANTSVEGRKANRRVEIKAN